MRNFLFIACLIFIACLSGLLISAKRHVIGKDTAAKRIHDTVLINRPLNVYNSPSQPDRFDIQKNMPWIGAILIGVMTVLVTLYTNRQSRANSLIAIEKQVASAKDIAEKNLILLKENNERDFKKTVLSANRQLWITSFRDTIADILSMLANIMNREEVRNEDAEKIRFLIAKADLMLNLTEHQVLISALEGLNDLCFEIQAGNKPAVDLEPTKLLIITQARTIIHAEWEKSKLGQ